MTVLISGRVQFQPFDMEDEDDCWIDISAPNSPFPVIETNAGDGGEHEQENENSCSPPGKTFDKAVQEECSRRTPLVQWNRCVEKQLVCSTQDGDVATGADDDDVPAKTTEDVGSTQEIDIDIKDHPLFIKAQKELVDMKLQLEETVKNLESAQVELASAQIEQEMALDDLKAEITAAKMQRDDMERKFWKKEEALARAKSEVVTLKNVISTATTMVTMQRDHSVTAAAEKEMILQNYREKIEKLKKELEQTKKREQEIRNAFQKEIEVLQETLASVNSPGKDEKEKFDDLLPGASNSYEVPPGDKGVKVEHSTPPYTVYRANTLCGNVKTVGTSTDGLEMDDRVGEKIIEAIVPVAEATRPMLTFLDELIQRNGQGRTATHMKSDGKVVPASISNQPALTFLDEVTKKNIQGLVTTKNKAKAVSEM